MKKKKEIIELEMNNIQYKMPNAIYNEKLLKPSEWALSEKIDPCLFAYWNKKLVNKKEFNDLKKIVGL